MPKGVYVRNDKHRAICSMAGKKSSAMKRKLWSCINCGQTRELAQKTSRKFCSVECHNAYQTPEPKSYGAIHSWMRRNFGTPSKCEHCGTAKSKKFEWANISGKYRLDRADWARLCCQCHRRYDFGTKNRIEVLNVY